ncbi:MAG: formylglycine-generating enzyme family protein [Firmicutes bacterium]|nr:formylglycine-generating enzyme family protein [Gammaproteobacteria bacterium]MCL5050525.1 formylglycine-generating enzyme family protein [Bacillota bacterium]
MIKHARSLALCGLLVAAFPAMSSQVVIPAGEFVSPVILDQEISRVWVDAFRLDAQPVTRGEFADFVRKHPEWQRDRTPRIFHDGGYLNNWLSAVEPGPAETVPVTQVSWFAARAYCEAGGGALPTLEQWEYALSVQRQEANLNDDDYAREVFAWYTQTPFMSRAENNDAMLGLLGQVNEWLEDYQLLLSNGEKIDFGGGSCGDTARMLANFDAAHYATFLRYQSRSNYTPVTTTSTLGFRCAYPVE